MLEAIKVDLFKDGKIISELTKRFRLVCPGDYAPEAGICTCGVKFFASLSTSHRSRY